jgi:hypothetical protein
MGIGTLNSRPSSVARAMSLWGRASRKLGESKTFRQILCGRRSEVGEGSESTPGAIPLLEHQFCTQTGAGRCRAGQD